VPYLSAALIRDERYTNKAYLYLYFTFTLVGYLAKSAKISWH